MSQFLPTTLEEGKEKGIDVFDFVLVSGDAYVDHPSFGVAIISRLLEANGYTVGIIPQPDWKDPNSVTVLGTPRLAFLVTGGNIDSMVNHYSVAKRRRDHDAYTPGGKIGHRPDRATIVYGNLIRQTYKETPIILGGIEASLRRLAHYDYWDDKIRRSILLDSAADILVYGMGEKAILEIASSLDNGIPVSEIGYVKGTAYRKKSLEDVTDYIELPDYRSLLRDKKKYADSFLVQTKEGNFASGKTLVESYDESIHVVVNPPMPPVSESEFDYYYSLPYTRQVHPMYTEKVPAIEEVQFSVISNRGCFGNCNFCALTFHQGRTIQARSHASILKEAEEISWDENFKGYIHDVGGPTANFRIPSCQKQLEHGPCKDKNCLGSDPCKQLNVDHSDYLTLLKRMRELPKIKKVFVRSGIRFDYLMYDKDDTFFKELVQHHISGQLKVAPEHVSNRVLDYMGKPHHHVYKDFTEKYHRFNKNYGMKQFIVPYLMSSHPGSTIDDAITLAEFLRDENIMPQQVQDFYPTPSTMSSVMYYTEMDPRTGKSVYVAKNPHEKAMQRALIQYRNPKNYRLVQEALIIAGREDLIGSEKQCLIFSKGGYKGKANANQHTAKPTKKRGKKKTIRNVHKKKK